MDSSWLSGCRCRNVFDSLWGYIPHAYIPHPHGGFQAQNPQAYTFYLLSQIHRVPTCQFVAKLWIPSRDLTREVPWDQLWVVCLIDVASSYPSQPSQSPPLWAV